MLPVIPTATLAGVALAVERQMRAAFAAAVAPGSGSEAADAALLGALAGADAAVMIRRSLRCCSCCS